MKRKKSKWHWEKFGILIIFLFALSIIGLEILKIVPVNKHAKQACYELIECNEDNTFTWEKEIKKNFTIEGTCKCENRTLSITVTKTDIIDIKKSEPYQGDMTDNISSSADKLEDDISAFVFLTMLSVMAITLLCLLGQIAWGIIREI